MKNLVIIGAGNFAREILGWLPGFAGCNTRWKLKGLLTDTTESLTAHGYTEPLLGSIAGYAIQPDDVFIVGIADCAARLALAEQLAARGATYETLIHETALISRHVTIGDGTVICPRVTISCDVTVGRHVLLNCSSGIGHDAVVGDGCTLSSYSELTGKVRLDRGVFLGSHATVLPEIRVGEFAVLGAGTAVIRDVAPRTTIVGVPGKRLPDM